MDSFVAMIMTWRHTSRFSMDNSVHIAHDDETGITDLAQYIIRSPFSLARLNFNHETGMVIYRSKMSHGKNKKTFTVSSAVAFIAQISRAYPGEKFSVSALCRMVLKSDAGFSF